MAKQVEREKAQALRRKGYSIGEIVKQIKEPKSTVSYWCKNIPLTDKQIANIQARHKTKSIQTLLAYSEKKRNKRLQKETKIFELGKKDIEKFHKRELFFLGLGLYWGEGYKYPHAEFGFTNSDPEMILVYISWLKEVLGVNSNSLVCRISINAEHKYRIGEVEKFWIKTTKLKKTQFTKVSYIQVKNKKVYKNSKKYYGTLRVKVRNGKDYKNRILGSIQAIIEQNNKPLY
jgi:hypothetical protein